MSATVKQWEQYYSTGALATGPTGPDGSYDLEVKELWNEFFSSLKPNAHVLDIGTGNGVVALIAMQSSETNNLSLEVHGSDLAQINPMRDVQHAPQALQHIQFHPGVASEALPMADKSFDAISGHYALEYADRAKALAEIYRVLKPGGKAQFVLHHRESILVKNALTNIEEGEFVIDKARLYRRLRDLLGTQQTTRDEAIKRGTLLQQAVREVKALLAQASQLGSGQMPRIALDATQTLMRMHGQLPPEKLAQEVQRAEQELKDATQRLHDLVGVASTHEQIEALKSLAQTTGFSRLEITLLHHNTSYLLGWVLRMQKD